MKRLLSLLAGFFLLGVSIASGQIIGTLSGLPATMPASTTSNLTGTAILVFNPPLSGIAFYPTFQVLTNGAASTGEIVLGFNLSPDNSTWTTTTPILVTNTITGTNSFTFYSSVLQSSMRNAQFIRLGSISNGATNTLTVGTIKYAIVP